MRGAGPALIDSPRLERYGFPSLEFGTSPAAGAHFVQPIEGGYFARLLSVHCRLVTSADVADRTVVVEYRDGQDQRYMLSGAPVSQTASSTNDWDFAVGTPRAEWPVDSSILVPLAAAILEPGQDFRIYVSGIEATDQLSAIRYTWERFYSSSPVPGIAY